MYQKLLHTRGLRLLGGLLGSLLLACGWFFTRKQVSPKH